MEGYMPKGGVKQSYPPEMSGGMLKDNNVNSEAASGTQNEKIQRSSKKWRNWHKEKWLGRKTYIGKTGRRVIKAPNRNRCHNFELGERYI